MQNITADRVILNLPSRPLHRLLQKSKLINSDWNQALYDFYQIRATKLYLYYETAWCVPPKHPSVRCQVWVDETFVQFSSWLKILNVSFFKIYVPLFPSFSTSFVLACKISG